MWIYKSRGIGIMAFTNYTTEDDNCAPYKKDRLDAGWDLRSNEEDFTLGPGAKVEVDTGIKVAIPRKYVGIIAPRSGLGTKCRVGLANTIGVIDSEYRGKIVVYLVNDGHMPVEIKKYDRVCQMLIMPVELQSMRKVGILSKTTRGDAGFGSTGES
jgi:dUTP pyrophosphatase